MKITSFNPLIVTKKAAECQELFEALGFEKRHDTPSGVDESIHTVRMKDANGFHVDITGFDQLPQDMTIIRMNVDDMDEAFQLLTAHGFTAIDGSKGLTSYSKSVMMTSPSGFSIELIKHIKKHD